MRSKLGALAGILLLSAMVAGASISVASAGVETELRFRAKTTEQEFLDLGEKGDSLGDQFIFHDVLRQEGERIGDDGGVCTLTSVDLGQFQCVVTAWLPDGQITSQGLVEPTGEFPERFVFAITGGTGAYEGASGEVRVIQRTETLARIIVRLAA
jgi:hypothetical protein